MARSDDESSETVFEARGVEVHQEANAKVAHAEVGEKLGLMNSEKNGDGFDLENDGVFDHDVGAKAKGNRCTLVDDGHHDLCFNADAGLCEFERQALGINGFQQAWADSAMDLDGEPDDPFGEGMVFKHEELP
jgi:hypothetical protein